MEAERPGPLTAYGRRVGRTAGLMRMLVPRELRVRYRQSVLDAAWALVVPVVTVAVYGVVLTQSFGVQASCGPYLSSAWIGLVIWVFFATATATALVSLISSSDLISKLYFPREAVPLSMVGAALVDLAIGVVTIFPLLLIQGVAPSVTWVALVLPLAVVIVWTAAIGIFVATIAAFVRDLVHGVNLLLRVGFFAVPVMYEASFLPQQLQWTDRYNPLSSSITGARDALMCGVWPDWALLGVQLLLGLAVLAAGVVYTSSVESRITDVV